MKIEERGLPPFLSYVNARLSGRPVHTAIWVIVMLLTCSAVYRLDAQRGAIGDIIMYVMVFFICVVSAALLSLAFRREGRQWLFAKYDDRTGKTVNAGSRIVVRLLPILGLVVVIEYYWAS